MAPCRFLDMFASIICTMVFFISCGDVPRYTGTMKPENSTVLKGKKIFIDPGHGGKGQSDPFRTGSGGITEESVNLRASLVLADMLRRAGATVALSRDADRDISPEERISMAVEFKPDILASVHHNASPRRVDPEFNYPCVMFWGTANANPASLDLALLLEEEFEKAMEIKGHVVSDFSVFHETGTRILRETRDLCPSVIGEFGFITDEKHAVRLRDPDYMNIEAEAYFTAITRYFERGLPDADLLVSCHLEGKSTLAQGKTVLALRFRGGDGGSGINEKTLKVSLDGVPVKSRRIKDDIYVLDCGEQLFPGNHTIKFSFRNLRYQSSMLLTASLYVPVSSGDYDRLVREGRIEMNTAGLRTRGLLKLLAAYSISKTDPGVTAIMKDISRGFLLLGLRDHAQDFNDRIQYFYPGSTAGGDGNKTWELTTSFTMDACGKPVTIYGDMTLP